MSVNDDLYIELREQRAPLCSHCGFSKDFHRVTDALCPGTYPGTNRMWRGAWEQNGAPGTTFEETSNE